MTSRLQNFTFSTSTCPKVKRCLSFAISSTGHVVCNHSNDAMVSPLGTAHHQHTRFQHRRLKAQSSGGCKETVSAFSRAICQSVHSLEQLYPDITRFPWNAVWRHANKEVCSLVIRSVLKACCTSPNCHLLPWLHTDCKTVIKKPSPVSVGEYDSMSRWSGAAKLYDESCLGPTSRCHAVVWLPHTSSASIPSDDLANVLSGCLILEQSLPLGIHALQ